MHRSLSKNIKENSSIVVAEEKTKNAAGWCTTLEKENPAVAALKRLSGNKKLKARAGNISDLLD